MFNGLWQTPMQSWIQELVRTSGAELGNDDPDPLL